MNAIVKKRCALAGLDPQDFSAHGLRSGFLTEAANRDIPIQDAMLQSRHRSLAQASSYYSDAGAADGGRPDCWVMFNAREAHEGDPGRS